MHVVGSLYVVESLGGKRIKVVDKNLVRFHDFERGCIIGKHIVVRSWRTDSRGHRSCTAPNECRTGFAKLIDQRLEILAIFFERTVYS